MTSRLRIIVTGLIAQHPTLGGLTWHYLQYAAGLAQLGHDVYYVEDSGEWPYNLDGGANGNDWVAHDCTANVQYLAKVMSRFGLAGKWAYRFPLTQAWFGLSETALEALIKSADLLVNVSGTLVQPERYGAIPRLAYIDTDPAFTHIKLALKEPDFSARVDAHNVHFSFGERLSDRTPNTGHKWWPTRMPILLSEWREQAPYREVFTTVMNWTSYKPLVFAGRTYGQKDMEFIRFMELPRRVGCGMLEVALGETQHREWEAAAVETSPAAAMTGKEHSEGSVRDVLTGLGWKVVDAMHVCGDMDAYRGYILSSKGEWSVAKNGYVVGRPGWFSDRSACYLAASRPVILQNTGFSDVLPVGEGILTFETIDEAVSAIRDVEGNYELHAKTAAAIADAYFNSDLVLGHVVSTAMS